MKVKDKELDFIVGKMDVLLEDAAYDRFKEFVEQNPVLAKVMAELCVRDPNMDRIVKIVWNKGYACGFVAAAQAAAMKRDEQ